MEFAYTAFLRRGLDSMKVGLLVVACLALTACGGGGGGSSGAAGSGGSLAITPTTMTFFVQKNQATPPAQVLTATYSETNVAQVVAGYPVGTTPPVWLSITPGGSTASPVTFNLSTTTSALSAGIHTATVVIGTGTSNGSVISIRNATVNYDVSDLVVNPNVVTLTAPNNTSPSDHVLVAVASSLGAVQITATTFI